MHNALAGTISREEADEVQKELMEERSNFVVQQNDCSVYEVILNLCRMWDFSRKTFAES